VEVDERRPQLWEGVVLALVVAVKLNTPAYLFLLIYLSTYIALILALCLSSKRFTFTLTLLAMLPG
jgi:hypothetical protein